MTAGYSDDDIAKFQSIAGDLGVGFQSIGSADELTNYLNSKDIGASDLSEAREGDQITSMSVFGHGFAGSAEFAYKQDNQASFSWSTDNVKQLNSGAFNNATIDLYTCNSATNTANGTSLANDLSARTNSTVTGYRGQSTYSKMNEGQGMGAKWNRYRNGLNTNGSVKLPHAGELHVLDMFYLKRSKKMKSIIIMLMTISLFSCTHKRTTSDFIDLGKSQVQFNSVDEYLAEKKTENQNDSTWVNFMFLNNPYNLNENNLVSIYVNYHLVYRSVYKGHFELKGLPDDIFAKDTRMIITMEILTDKNKKTIWQHNFQSKTGFSWNKDYKIIYCGFFPTNEDEDYIRL